MNSMNRTMRSIFNIYPDEYIILIHLRPTYNYFKIQKHNWMKRRKKTEDPSQMESTKPTHNTLIYIRSQNSESE